MSKPVNHFGVCPLCKEVNPFGSEIITWQLCTEDFDLKQPKDIRCGNCDGMMSVEDWKPESGREPLRLKIWPQSFEDVCKGLMSYQMRRNDRNYQVGDQLILCEFEPHKGEYTEREVHCTVIHITPGGRQGLLGAHCILGISVHGIRD